MGSVENAIMILWNFLEDFKGDQNLQLSSELKSREWPLDHLKNNRKRSLVMTKLAIHKMGKQNLVRLAQMWLKMEKTPLESLKELLVVIRQVMGLLPNNHRQPDMDTVENADSESLSDIDDVEERKQKRAEEAKNSAPPKNAAEATRNMLAKKRLGSKINYDVLEKLFEDLPVIENKKKRGESDIHNDDEDHHNIKGEQQMELDDAENADFGTEDGYGEEDDAAVGNEDYLYGNEDYVYGYDEDYGGDY